MTGMLQATAEPGARAPAPGALRLVQQFVNSNDLEGGPDLLADAPALHAWLVEAGLAGPDLVVTGADHARAVALREAIRELVSANAGLPHDPAAAQVVDELGAGLRPVFDSGGTHFEPTAGGVDAALGRIVGAIHNALAEGTWERLKACERDVCRWAFYDQSKNRSSHWCSMAVCGQREKNRRAYRRRRAR
jgi:predicted RNA-binding Zn ribbon-like protein